MEFNSLTFVVFFGVVLLLHNVPFSWRVKKFNLLCASYVFYAAWNPPFVLLLIGATAVDWFAARGIYNARTEGRRTVWLVITLLSNLGVLGFFKYGNFLLENFQTLARIVGWDYNPPRFYLVLPIGISFYTFVKLSYVLDVYFQKMKPWTSYLDYALLVTFFPHLVAGPILRAHDFLPQCTQPQRPTRQQFSWGMAMFTLGLFQKQILADHIFAPAVEKVYKNVDQAGFVEGWTGAMAFAGQIFNDFAGYSTCAIGIALCLGFKFPRNFNCPYAAAGFSDFWRRWHISLSSFLRDYLYIPLGGNRGGDKRVHFNLMLTMLIGGLWHGASWTFVAWGGLHGLYLVGERWLKTLSRPKNFWSTVGGQFLIIIATYLLVCVAWVVFRANTLPQAIHLVGVMFGAGQFAHADLLNSNQILVVAVVTAGLLGVHWLCRDLSLEDSVSKFPWMARSIALTAMLVIVVVIHVDDHAFIYFQF